MKNFLKYIYFIFGFVLGYQIGDYLYEFDWIKALYSEEMLSTSAGLITSIVSGICFGLLLIIFIPAMAKGFEKVSQSWVTEIRKTSPSVLILRVIALITALALASLICTPIYKFNIIDILKVLIIFCVYAALIYLSMLLVNNMGGDIEGFFKSLFNRERIERDENKVRSTKRKSVVVPKILDTSVIIDGRIFDILSTGFIDGPIIIPTFVVDELQYIADSADATKRNRGRRGLDLLNKMQNELPLEVVLTDKNYPDIPEVDSKLIKLAKDMKGKVVTNDYNLNKVSEIHGVKVLNTNDLSNTVKAVVLPGEEINVHVLKEGKENNQGIAYLDDGTMIVVEEGKNLIGKDIKANVTSVLQTSAGRLVFVKPN